MRGKTDNQDGFAAIIIAIVLILVLSLTTVGFAQLMRREQRQALDKQLSSQAYYAAESGVNEATAAINAGYNLPKTNCDPISDPSSISDPVARNAANLYLKSNTVSTKTASSFPCLLINPTPLTLEWSSVGQQEDKVVELKGVSSTTGAPAAITSLVISWEDADSGKNFAPADVCGDTANPNPKLKPASGSNSWNYTGMLRAQLTPITDLSRQGLSNNAYTAFLCPNGGTSGSLATGNDYNYAAKSGLNSGVVLKGNCSDPSPGGNRPRNCNVEIVNMQTIAPNGESTYFLTLRSIYKNTRVTVAAYQYGTQLAISDAQTLVDSTGKAQDVLRRIQVRVPAHNSYSTPASGSQGTGSSSDTTGICKQLDVYPNGGGSGC